MALSCSQNGQAQVPPPAPVVPPQSNCNVQSLYGQITGDYNLRLTVNGKNVIFKNSFLKFNLS